MSIRVTNKRTAPSKKLLSKVLASAFPFLVFPLFLPANAAEISGFDIGSLVNYDGSDTIKLSADTDITDSLPSFTAAQSGWLIDGGGHSLNFEKLSADDYAAPVWFTYTSGGSSLSTVRNFGSVTETDADGVRGTRGFENISFSVKDGTATENLFLIQGAQLKIENSVFQNIRGFTDSIIKVTGGDSSDAAPVLYFSNSVVKNLTAAHLSLTPLLILTPAEASQTTTKLKAGHLYYWPGGNAFVVNFKDFDTFPYKEVHVGKITDATASGFLENSGSSVAAELR
jgi:hypothetical protein